MYCAFGVFLFSLTFVQWPHEGWDAGDRFRVSADRVAVGLPLPWIGWTTLKVTGDAPPLNELPEGRKWKPGVYFDAPRFVLVPAFALALAAGIMFAVAGIRERMMKQGAMPTRMSLVLVALVAAAVGALVPTAGLIGLGLGLALLVAIAVATWRNPRVITVAAYAVIGVGTGWWAQRIASYFSTRYKPIEGFDWEDDALGPVVTATGAFVFVMGVHFVRRLLSRVTSGASSPPN